MLDRDETNREKLDFMLEECLQTVYDRLCLKSNNIRFFKLPEELCVCLENIKEKRERVRTRIKDWLVGFKRKLHTSIDWGFFFIKLAYSSNLQLVNGANFLTDIKITRENHKP
jgi:hypothetical protein